MTIFGWPLGFIMLGCYMITGNIYALAIVLFTIITKVALLPLSIKQQKEQAKMAIFQPKLQAIQKKYANNKERYNEEIQKLYTEEGYNPMSGCLPMLIQFPILFGVLDVVYKPLYHILRISNNAIAELQAIAEAAGHSFTNSYYNQINLIDIIHKETELFAAYDQEIIGKILEFDMNMFGLDLGVVPQFALTYEGAFNWYLLIPIACGLFQLLGTVVSMKSNPNANAGGASMNIMMYTMPLLSVYIGFVVPAAAGFYWTVSAVAQMFQSLFLHVKYNPKDMAEKIQAEMDAEKESKRQKRIEAREKYRELQKQGGKSAKEDVPFDKEANRKKLAEARKRSAEKYGEEYVEVTDDDLK